MSFCFGAGLNAAASGGGPGNQGPWDGGSGGSGGDGSFNGSGGGSAGNVIGDIAASDTADVKEDVILLDVGGKQGMLGGTAVLIQYKQEGQDVLSTGLAPGGKHINLA
jgi:hypothetical protein